MAPSCIAMMKLERNSLSGMRKSSEVITRCAVEDIGRNSVNPSTMPRMTA